MEYIPETLYKELKTYSKAKKMSLLLIKLYSYQIIRELAYMHAFGICLRDMKPQNPWYTRIDFVSAKKLVPGQPNISYISYRLYRTPELIFG